MRPSREQPFGQARQEDDAEAAAARLMRAADEDAAVSAIRRLDRQQPEALGEHVAHFPERHGADVGERSQLRQHAQHARRTPQYPRHERMEPREPRRPEIALGPSGQLVDQRQREVPEAAQVPALALDGGNARRLRFVADERLELACQLRVEAPQPPVPSVAVVNELRVDQQVFPLPRGTQRARGNRVQSVAAGIGGLDLPDRLARGVRRLAVLFVGPVGPRLGGGTRLVSGRHLAERQVFGEPASGQVLGRARQQRKQRPPGGIGPAGAAIEPRRDPGSRAGMFEEPDVLLRRSHEHGHLVEAHAVGGACEDSPRDLQALPAFAGCGEQLHRCVPLGLRRRIRREQVPPEPRQRRGGPIVGDGLDGQSQRDKRVVRLVILGRQRHERRRRSGDQRGDDVGLERVGDGDVQQHERLAPSRRDR